MKIKLIAIAVCAALPVMAHADIAAWRIEAAGLTPIDAAVDVVEGHYWIFPDDALALGINSSKLNTVNGLVDLTTVGEVTIDPVSNTLKVATKPQMLPVTTIDLANHSNFIKPSNPEGSYLNYDIRGEQVNGMMDSHSLAALLEANTFIKYGIRLNYQGLLKSNEAPQRVAANVSKEDSESAITWSLGDAYSLPGTGVAPVRFIGAQYRKDFSLQPGFITSPTFNVAGVAAAPATVDVLVGGQTARSIQVPAGPFDITNLQPTIGASGAQVIMRDVFGQEQVINSPVLGNPSLLKVGTDDFAIQGGVIRTTPQHTENPFISGFYRRGINSTLTLEGNAEASEAGSTLPNVRHIGINAAVATNYGNLSLGGRLGSGSTANIGYQNAWYRNGWNVSLNGALAYASADYRQMGGGSVAPLIKTVQSTIQYERISFNSLLTQSNGLSLASLGLVFSPITPKAITWSASAILLSGTTNSATLSVFASIPIDGFVPLSKRTHQQTAGISQTGNQYLALTDYLNRPTDSFGTSYRVHAESSSVMGRLEGYADHRAFGADFGASVSAIKQSQNNQTGLRAYARGSVVNDGDFIGLTRWIDAGYAVVEAGTPDAVVLVNGTPNAKTNEDGFAVTSGFEPFHKTTVQLSPDSIPDNFDDEQMTFSTFRKAGTKVAFKSATPLSQVMVRVRGHKEGVMTIEGRDYPITDRGAFLELEPGSYSASIGAKDIEFFVPKTNSRRLTVYAKFTERNSK